MLLILAAGIFLRAVFWFFAYSFDVNSFIAWSKDSALFGFSGFYERVSSEVYSTLYPNYPPLSILLFNLCYRILAPLKFLVWQLNLLLPIFPSKLVFALETRQFLAGLMKIPASLAEIGIAILVYQIVKKISVKRAYLALFLVLFNPIFIYVSSIWGQTDSLSTFFVLWSFYSLLFLAKKLLPYLFLALALLSKQSAIVFLPIFVVVAWKKYGWLNLVKGAVLTALVFWLVFLPFYQIGNILTFPFSTYINKMLLASSMTFASNRAFNFWAIVSGWEDVYDSRLFLGLEYRLFGYFLTAVFTLPVVYKALREKPEPKVIFVAMFLTVFASYLFLTRIHERHLQQALIILIPIAAINKKYLRLFLLLSFLHFINLYNNWSAFHIPSLATVLQSPLTTNASVFIILWIFINRWANYLRETHSGSRSKRIPKRR